MFLKFPIHTNIWRFSNKVNFVNPFSNKVNFVNPLQKFASTFWWSQTRFSCNNSRFRWWIKDMFLPSFHRIELEHQYDDDFMTSPWILQKSFQTSASSFVSVGWNLSGSFWSAPLGTSLLISCSRLRRGVLRIRRFWLKILLSAIMINMSQILPTVNSDPRIFLIELLTVPLIGSSNDFPCRLSWSVFYICQEVLDICQIRTAFHRVSVFFHPSKIVIILQIFFPLFCALQFHLFWTAKCSHTMISW